VLGFNSVVECCKQMAPGLVQCIEHNVTVGEHVTFHTIENQEGKTGSRQDKHTCE
jgi:hypothetical protein